MVRKDLQCHFEFFLPKPLPLGMTTFCAFHRQLCIDLDPNVDRDIALFTELVQSAKRTVTVPVHLNFQSRQKSRYGFSALLRLFAGRSHCYKLSRVLLWLAGSVVLMLASAVSLLVRATFSSLVLAIIFSSVSFMLAWLAIMVRASSRTSTLAKATRWARCSP